MNRTEREKERKLAEATDLFFIKLKRDMTVGNELAVKEAENRLRLLIQRMGEPREPDCHPMNQMVLERFFLLEAERIRRPD